MNRGLRERKALVLETDQTGVKYVLANAKRFPEGEKETSCTQPPLGLANSPQTVLNGNFSPHTVGSGLYSVSISGDSLGQQGTINSLAIHTLDESGEHARLCVSGPGCEQDVVRVPIDGQDGRSKGFLQVLGCPPVVFLVKGTDGNGSAGRAGRVLVRNMSGVVYDAAWKVIRQCSRVM